MGGWQAHRCGANSKNIESLSYDPFDIIPTTNDGENYGYVESSYGFNTKEAAKRLGATTFTISLWEKAELFR
jgi:hypothetical protein